MSAYDPWAPVYDAMAADMTDDVPFYVELAREAQEPVVELAVGSGRVAIPIARETGKRVIGIDGSPAMLAVARERAAEMEALYGWFDRRPFADDSTEFVWVARKPA